MRHGRFWFGLSLVVFCGWAITVAQPPKQPTSPKQTEKVEKDEEPSPEEEKEKAIAERFRKVLETNPRRGTALDRLYGYHVERGTLDKLIVEYRERTTKDPKDGVAWMIAGLLESQRGKDAAAVAAFRQAEANLPDNPVPGYYLGQSLVLVGQPEAAAEAYERAIIRKPNRNDLLDIFQALGRVYQRAQRPEKALEVWNRLEKLFPDDARVQEQIAATLVEEGQFDQALPRLMKLAEASEDKYRQTSFRIDAAELKVKLKKTTDALADFEKLLAELDPDSWLYRDVRRRIEDVFLRGDDLAGLAKYYEKWLEKNATDVDVIARLAKNLSSQGRAPEARTWLEKGIAVAPSNRQLRQGLIDQLVFEQNFAAAAKQYEEMEKNDPNNPDTLREWGKMLLRDTARPEAERKSAAATVWKRLLEKKPNDPVSTSQVADLMRTAGAVDEAIALYKKAIQLAPNAAQYREYLGEYYHSLSRSDEAIAAWRPIAEGANRSSKNLARLAEVFAGFGYRKEAMSAMADAISLEPDDFSLLMTYAELLHQDGQHDLALAQIAAASAHTSNPEEVEQVLLAQIKVYQATDKLADEITALEKELGEGKDATAERWLRLARFFESNRQADKASEAIGKAAEKDPKSVTVLIASARIYESAGNLLAAADANRKLAALDRRYRSDYLTAVAKLEQRLGRREQALQAGRDLLAASPGNPEVYKFYADLCFQLGDQEEGLDSLRRSVRANPSDPQGLITLANALSERIRQGEAIELLWRAFDKTNELEAKLGIIERITQLYLENNQFDRLIERLERERREADKVREMTMCLAQAYTTAGDLGTARGQLERLLTENNRDTNLLGQLVSLCESEGDIAAALKYQRQLNVAAPNNYDHQLKLAQLLTRSGEADAAAEIWVKLVAGESEPHRTLTSIDQLLSAGKLDAAQAILGRLITQKPGNWELIYREGATLMARGQAAPAIARFKAIMAMKLADDELGEITKYQIKQAKKKAAKPGQQQVYNPYNRSDDVTRPPLLRRTGNVWNIRTAVGMEARAYYRNNQQAFYVPGDYGEARMACLGFLYEAARAEGKADEYAKQLRLAKDKAGADPRPLWDWYYFQALRSEKKDVLSTALALSKGSDPAGLLAFLVSVENRENSNSGRRGRQQEGKDKTQPLPPEQLSQVLESFRKLKQVKPDWVAADITQVVMTELKRAKRNDEEVALYREFIKNATTIEKVQSALGVAVERNDMDATLDLFTRLEKLQPPAKTASGRSQLLTRQTWGSLLELMGKRADDKKFGDVLAVLDHYLAIHRKQNIATAGSVSTMRRFQSSGMSIQTYSKMQQYNRNNAQITYPSANEYYDEGAISLLYNAYDLYKKADLVSDLLLHFRDKLAKSQGAERLYHQLALGYLHWWAEEKEDAVAVLTEAIQAMPADHNLLLEVASLREQNNEPEAALTLLDSITPLDTQMMQRREDAALRLAERTGNVERARRAAERLFGLRLDADKQLELAGKMHRLGMSQLAETVLNRAQRQAGNKTATLLRLMTQYQAQNQSDLAVLIARQILRKGPSANFNTVTRGRDETDNARNQAIGVLARSGQLKEMIERAEAQLKTSPKSLQIHQVLVGYYQASGDKEKLKATLLAMAEIKPEDGKLRFQAAQELQHANQRDAAIAQYIIAIKLDPTAFMYRYWEVQNLFMQANKFEELAKLFEEVDLRKIGNYWVVFNLISQLLQDEKGRETGMKLFKKAWASFPQNRSEMLSQLYDESIWRLPEIYNYSKEAVIPREDSEIEPWQLATDNVSWGGVDGRVDAVITRMMSIARKQQRLPELKAEAAAALIKRPEWLSGKVLLAVIEIQMGNKEAGKKIWQEVFNDPKLDIPPLARFIMTQELEFYSGVEDMALKTLEDGAEEMMKAGEYDFSSNPVRRLIWWYEQLGRPEDAKKLQLRFATIEQTDPGYGGGYWYYRLVQNKLMIAQDLQRLGETIEAVRLFNALLADKDTLNTANQYSGGGEQFSMQIEQGLQQALKDLKPSALPKAVGVLLTPREVTPLERSALDLVVLFESRNLTKARLNCVLAAAIKSTEKAPEIRRDALTKLEALVKQYPNDFSVQTAAALTAFAEGKPGLIREALDRLRKLMEENPLEVLPAKKKANARQRAEARPQVLLWLVARECLSKDKEREPYRELGEKFAERAAAAAKRHEDELVPIAVLREWGQLELDRGEKAKAEALWNDLLQFLMPKSKPVPTTGAATPQPVPPAAVVPAAPLIPATKPPLSLNDGNWDLAFISTPAPRRVRVFGIALILAASQAIAAPQAPPAMVGPVKGAALTESRGNANVLTVEQFQKVYAVASFAAEKGLPALSLKAMKDAVSGGPPVPGTVGNNNGRFGGRLSMRSIGGTQYYVSDSGEEQIMTVERALLELVPRWRELKVPAAAMYEIVAAAVLPESRPAEVFIYADGHIYGTVYTLNPGGWLEQAQGVGEDVGEDRGLCVLLCDLAIAAGKVEDLRAKAKTRTGQPLGELPALVLLSTLAMQSKDDARALELFKTLGERIQKDSLQGTNDRATSVLLPALANPNYADVVIPFIDKAAANYLASNNQPRAAELRFKLARHYLAKKDEAAARAQYKLVEAFGKKINRNAYSPTLPLASEYLKAGWLEEALSAFGEHTDSITTEDATPHVREKRAEPSIDHFPQLVRLLLVLPAAKRYELLKNWSLPAGDRKWIRYYVGLMPSTVPPARFVALPKLPLHQPVNTMLLLAEAAAETGKLEELVASVEKLATEKVENADIFRVLLKLSKGKPTADDPTIKEFVEAALKRMVEKNDEGIHSRYYDPDDDNRMPPAVRISDLLTAQFCLAHPALTSLGEKLLGPIIEKAERTGRLDCKQLTLEMRRHLEIARKGAKNPFAGAIPSRWKSDTDALWLAQQGYLSQAESEQEGCLIFDTPLTGAFEFSVEFYTSAQHGAQVGYGGVLYEHGSGPQATASSLDHSDQVGRSAPGARAEQFNRMTIQVSPGKVRALVNGEMFFEDTDAPRTSPWLMLFANAGQRPVFRNPTLTGKPEIPLEVKLSGGDWLGGWMATDYPASLPLRLTLKEQENGIKFDRWGNPLQSDARQNKYDWLAKDGEIIGRKLDQFGSHPVPSHLSYGRPLLEGETLRYEFFYEPDKTLVHPSLGHLAFLLEPEGVSEHWLSGLGDDWTGMAADNRFVDAGSRRGGKLPLKIGDWNALAIALTSDSVKLELNGALIYETKLPAETERRFGLFHDRGRTTSRVRNVFLRGAWPKTLPVDVSFTVKAATGAEALVRRGQLGERYFSSDIKEFLVQTRKLPPVERYAALADWVLPSDTKPVFQITGVFTPQDVLGVVDQKDQPPGQRVLLGNRFDAPCLELIAAAKAANKLDELAERLGRAELPIADDTYRRSKVALLIAIQAAQGRDAAAAAGFKSLMEFTKKMAPDSPDDLRWPDLIAVTSCLDKPSLLKPAGELAEAMNANLEQAMIQKREFERKEWWVSAARDVRARLLVASQPDGLRRPFGSDPGLAYWSPVVSLDATSRGQGHGVPHWTYHKDLVTHYPGHGEDYLLFRTPLRGDFEVACELKLEGWQEAQIRYGSYQFDLSHDRKKYTIHSDIRHGSIESTITPPLPENKTKVYKFRLVVKDGWFRAFVDDREVIAEKIGLNPEPWLMFHCAHDHSGELRNVTIGGKPTIPEKVDLLADDGLGLWKPYLGMMGGNRNNSVEGWIKRGEEIHEPGKKPEPPEDGKPAPPREHPESAIYYQRPMIENGTIDYEFFYFPEKALVHPMLDRLVFLLEPDGVRLHWLTDGAFESGKAAIDSAKDEPECRRGPKQLPLKERAWNRVRLTVAGDSVKLTLNGTDIYERAIESTNQRFFGLFHYTDRTEARARSIVYSGDWPRTLPTNDKLFEKK